jgi:hypothetical protein
MQRASQRVGGGCNFAALRTEGNEYKRAERATRWSPLRTERTNADMRGSIKLRGPHSTEESKSVGERWNRSSRFHVHWGGWTRRVFLKNAGRISAARSVPALPCAASGVVRLRAADRHRFISLPTPAFAPVAHFSPTTPRLPRAPWHARSFSASPARHNQAQRLVNATQQTNTLRSVGKVHPLSFPLLHLLSPSRFRSCIHPQVSSASAARSRAPSRSPH